MLAALGAQTFAETFRADNSPDDIRAHLAANFRPDVQARELADSTISILVAECDGEPAGYAKLQRSEVPPCVGEASSIEIARIYVAARFHGRGIGAALMKACLKSARTLGAKKIWLGVWERNGRAQAFYRRFDFVECGDHEFVLGSDRQRDIIMMRSTDEDGK
jgi:ribosomal protein S18 acetylase RimI-like enzyme